MTNPWVAAVLGASLIAASCAPGPKVASTPETPPDAGEPGVAELADGVLSVLVFPVLDQPFMAPNLEGGVLPERGGTRHFQGIDADLMASFAAAHGVEVEFVRLNEPGFDRLIPALVEGHGDIVASGISITEARERLVDFSRPYFSVETVIVARRGARLRQLAQLEGKSGVAVAGSRPIDILRQVGFEGPIRGVDFPTDAYAEVADGSADFAALESASAEMVVRQRAELEIAMSLPVTEGYGFGVADGSALRPLLDRFIEGLTANGELDTILARHLDPEGEATAAPSNATD